MRHVAGCVRHEIRAVTSLSGTSGPGLLLIGKIINIFGTGKNYNLSDEEEN